MKATIYAKILNKWKESGLMATTTIQVKGHNSAVLSIPASEEDICHDVQNVMRELSSIGIRVEEGSVTVSHKPTINSNNGG